MYPVLRVMLFGLVLKIRRFKLPARQYEEMFIGMVVMAGLALFLERFLFRPVRAEILPPYCYWP